MRKLILALCVLLAGCGGGGEEDEYESFAVQAEQVCENHGGVLSWRTAEWSNRNGESVTVLSSVSCRDGLVRAS